MYNSNSLGSLSYRLERESKRLKFRKYFTDILLMPRMRKKFKHMSARWVMFENPMGLE